MNRVIQMNGEGLMLKDPKGLYVHKRTEKLLKVKKFDDAEAIITGYQNGTGRCADMMGAVFVKL